MDLSIFHYHIYKFSFIPRKILNTELNSLKFEVSLSHDYVVSSGTPAPRWGAIQIPRRKGEVRDEDSRC